MAARPPRPLLAALLAALGTGCTAGSESAVEASLDRYYAAYDTRAAAFCACFHDLVGYADAETCLDGWELTASEKGCIDGIFVEEPDEPPRQYSPAPAIDCLAEVEQVYAACLTGLACDDFEGLNACIRERNAGVLECPRLSTLDSGAFETCWLL